MRVFVNWETQEIIGPNQVEETIDRKLSEYLENDDLLEIQLEERYSLAEVWKMDDKQKKDIMKDFIAYQREYVEDHFDKEFCEYEVE